MTTVLDVGVDLDDVNYSLFPAHRQYRVQHLGADPASMPDPTEWNYFPSWGLPDVTAFFNDLHAAVDAGVLYTWGEPMPGCVNAINRLTTAGHRVHFKTARFFGSDPDASEKATKAWLREHGYRYESLTFCHDKTDGPRCDVFIDDKLENYDDLDRAGVLVFLRDQPWNQDDGQRRRVPDLPAFVDLILELAPQIACQRPGG